MIVIASIHQPSTDTLMLFDNVLLLSQGKTIYFGPPGNSNPYFTGQGYPPQPFVSPAEWMLDLVNIDFIREHGANEDQLDRLIKSWEGSPQRQYLLADIVRGEHDNEIFTLAGPLPKGYPRGWMVQTWIQFHRMLLVFTLDEMRINSQKSYRDFLAYGVRIAMYLALAILMGTAWLRLSYDQQNIQNVLNSLFFGSAFMSFMVNSNLR